jgi:hypothetical protein
MSPTKRQNVKEVDQLLQLKAVEVYVIFAGSRQCEKHILGALLGVLGH